VCVINTNTHRIKLATRVEEDGDSAKQRKTAPMAAITITKNGPLTIYAGTYTKRHIAPTQTTRWKGDSPCGERGYAGAATARTGRANFGTSTVVVAPRLRGDDVLPQLTSSFPSHQPASSSLVPASSPQLPPSLSSSPTSLSASLLVGG
jgi:hypothetical protein